MITKLFPGQVKEWWIALSVGLLSWLWIFPKVLVGLHWHDTSEFIAASRTLAVSHPPGHPLTVIFMHIAQLIPFFDCAERSHLASSFWGALGTGIMYLGLFELLLTPKGLSSFKREVLARIAFAVAALCSICLPLVILQVTRAEVYAPQWACTTAVWYCLFYAQKHSESRAYLWAAFFLGLLSSNHTLLALVLILGLIPKLITLKLNLKVWGLSTVAYLLGLSLYSYLWFRGTDGGLSGWGWIIDLKSFWETISAKVWQIQVEQRSAELDFIDNITRMLAFGMRQVGLIMSLVLSLVLGLGTLAWVKKWRGPSTLSSLKSLLLSIQDGWSLTLLLTSILIMMTKLTYPFSEGNPDFSGYMAAAVPSLIFLFAQGTQQFAQHLSQRREYEIILIIFLSLLISTQQQNHYSRPPESRGAEAWGRSMTQNLPTAGTLWTSFYASHFITVALQTVEGWRSDINLVFRGHRRLDWSLPRLNTLPKLSTLTSIDRVQDLRQAGSRFEVERPLDSVTEIWPILSWPNTLDGLLSTCFKDECIRDSDANGPSTLKTWRLVDRFEQNQSVVLLGNAHTSSKYLNSKTQLIDEDSAYAWALHYEMSFRWLTQQKLILGHSLPWVKKRELDDLINDCQALKSFWIKVIAEEKWNSIDFSWSDP